ncbi:hypothetical protein [Mesorhizobium sp. ORM16]|uniref:hypothetical protein n=1 Tax=Mesorhizobium sp. ORM16 TaxID=3376989 RepID=UPI003857B686
MAALKLDFSLVEGRHAICAGSCAASSDSVVRDARKLSLRGLLITLPLCIR